MKRYPAGFNLRKPQENVLVLGWFNKPLIAASAWVLA
jgi:adenine-specific DNA methylase